MATARKAKLTRSAGSRQARRRRWPWVVGAVLLGVLAWYWAPLMGYARTGAAYGAHVACSCRYIEGRSLGDCRKDFEKGMGLITLSEDAKAKSVTARFPLLSRQTATYVEGQGCVLESWSG